MALIETLAQDKQLHNVRLENNYFSEQVEQFVLEQLGRN